MPNHRWATNSTRATRVSKWAGSPVQAGPGGEARWDDIHVEDDIDDEEDGRQKPSRMRWVAGRGAILVFLGLALTVGYSLFAARVSGTPPTLASVPLPSLSVSPGVGQRPDGSQTEPAFLAAPSITGSAAPAGAGTVVVHVAGAVKWPGIVELPGTSRIFEAIRMAGGMLAEADASRINLAEPVQDGTQIYVPVQGENPDPGAGTAIRGESSAAGDAGIGPVDLNRASSEELQALPRVGPVLAERIIAWRTEQGPFTSTEELDAVPGIGPAMLEALLPLVSVS